MPRTHQHHPRRGHGRVLHGLWNGGDGALKVDVRKAANEAYEKAGLFEGGKKAIGESSWHLTWTTMTRLGWLERGKTSSMYRLSPKGCEALGLTYGVTDESG